jgi:hypothetical protein
VTTIDCDDSRWPLVSCTFSGNLRDEDFDGYLEFLARCHVRRQLWGLLLDASAVRGVNATQRRRMADFLAEHEGLSRKYCAGTAFVIDSPLVRGTLTAIFWFQKQPTPYVVVARRAQAHAWLDQQLDKARHQVALASV